MVLTPDSHPKVVFWHLELPPLGAEPAGVHTVEADSLRVPGSLERNGELWDLCYQDLMTRARHRLVQEMDRLGGHYAHVHDESLVPRHDDASGESWLHGVFTYMLYTRPPREAEPKS